MGDAVLVACVDPTAGVRFLRTLFARLDRDAQLPLVRAGAHHGPAIRRDGDYFGTALNVTARAADLADPCQILATQAVAEAARAQRIDVIDLGRFELRHITDPVELFELDCGLDARGHTIDPVCRMRVGRDHAIATVRYGGNQYSFCSLESARRFTAAPTTFLRPT